MRATAGVLLCGEHVFSGRPGTHAPSHEPAIASPPPGRSAIAGSTIRGAYGAHGDLAKRSRRGPAR